MGDQGGAVVHKTDVRPPNWLGESAGRKNRSACADQNGNRSRLR